MLDGVLFCFWEQVLAYKLFWNDWVALRRVGWYDLMQANLLFGLTLLTGLAGRS